MGLLGLWFLGPVPLPSLRVGTAHAAGVIWSLDFKPEALHKGALVLALLVNFP